MRKFKRFLAGMMASCFILSSLGFTTVQAKNVKYEVEEQQTTEEHQTTEKQQTDTTMLLNYLVIGSNQVALSEEQFVFVNIGQDTDIINSATLVYKNTTTDQQLSATAEVMDGNDVVFYTDTSVQGLYEIEAIVFCANETDYEIRIADTGLDTRFGVAMEIEEDIVQTLDGLTFEEDDIPLEDIVIYADEEIEASDIADSMAAEGMALNVETELFSATEDGKIVICLDPGHGGSDTGAIGNGLNEKDVNLKIAEYCKARLEMYNNVVVYMTRTDDSYVGLSDRADYAASVSADALISLHNNAAANTEAKGCMVCIPNKNYNEAVYATGHDLAYLIVSELTYLGIDLRPTPLYVRDYSPEGGASTTAYYPDGSIQDYYAICRYAKLKGIPGIIVEHAFISNEEDAKNYLSTDMALMALGEADADAIARFFNLTPSEKLSSNTFYKGVDYSDIYDYDFYVNYYSDIEPYCQGNPRMALMHFVEYGIPEGRIGKEVLTKENARAMHRLYNPNSGEHFYTASLEERDQLVSVGWNYEGIAWYAPEEGDPVYRLYNPNAGDHHYTLSEEEKDSLVAVGWNYEGIAWRSAGSVPMFRLYNPNAVTGSHHYTKSQEEVDMLTALGWKFEGKAWYAYE